MELTCTLAQANSLRALLSAQVICSWVRDPNDATRVLVVALSDTRMGSNIIRFATDADKPLVTQLQSAFTNNVEVSGIS